MARRKRNESPNPGLTPPAMQEEIRKKLGIKKNGTKMREVRSADKGPKQPAVSKSRPRTLAESGGGGVFGTSDVQDTSGAPEDQCAEVSDSGRNSLELVSMRDLLEIEVKRINEDEGVPYLTCIVRQVVRKAAKGEQASIAFIRDIIEGRPGQAPSRPVRMEDVEKQLDNAEVNLLNRMMETD